MRINLLSAILILGLLSLAEPVRAAALNQVQVHTAYNEGNFDYVIATLESFIKSNKTYGQEDSVFIAKHLAVVYSANPATREKGRYYMNRLLELVPSAKLVDMYVSEEIDRIFDKVREEFLTRQRSFGISQAPETLPARPQSTPQPAAPAAPTREPRKKGKGMIWFAGGVGVAVVAGGVAYYALHEGDAKAEDKVYAVPK
jgi:hypothetical protein